MPRRGVRLEYRLGAVNRPLRSHPCVTTTRGAVSPADRPASSRRRTRGMTGAGAKNSERGPTALLGTRGPSTTPPDRKASPAQRPGPMPVRHSSLGRHRVSYRGKHRCRQRPALPPGATRVHAEGIRDRSDCRTRGTDGQPYQMSMSDPTVPPANAMVSHLTSQCISHLTVEVTPLGQTFPDRYLAMLLSVHRVSLSVSRPSMTPSSGRGKSVRRRINGIACTVPERLKKPCRIADLPHSRCRGRHKSRQAAVVPAPGRFRGVGPASRGRSASRGRALFPVFEGGGLRGVESFSRFSREELV